MDLIARVQGFMAGKRRALCQELSEKYGVPEDEISDVVDSFLKDSYGPAMALAEAIHDKEIPVLLFIGKKDCPICRRCLPDLEKFLLEHKDMERIMLDYSLPQALLYHMIQQQDKGTLPMIAMIFRGCIHMVLTGECVHPEIYEEYYNSMRSGCSQSLYAH